jgi:F-type H+-transporting ATPase subunit c
MVPAIVEGRAVLKALEGISRQPESANDIRTTLLISLALLESTAIYVLLVMLILLFANPLLDRFFA